MSGFDQETSPDNTKQWTMEQIRKEAVKFYLANESKLNRSSLLKKGQGDLLHAIETFYPGGLAALKRWVTKDVQRAAISILQKYNNLLESGEIISFDEFIRRFA